MENKLQIILIRFILVIKKYKKKSSSQKKKVSQEGISVRLFRPAAVSENKSDEHCYFSELKSVGSCVSFFKSVTKVEWLIQKKKKKNCALRLLEN